MDPSRARIRNTYALSSGPILYWMSRDQRVRDNWSLVHALELAKQVSSSVHVVVSLRDNLTTHAGTARMLDFMLSGLREVEQGLSDLNIPFTLTLQDPVSGIAQMAQKVQAGAVVGDFSPLRINQYWMTTLANSLMIPVIEVDAHNIVPAWIASTKQEYAAHTFRKKIHRLLPQYLTEFPTLHPQKSTPVKSTTDWTAIRNAIAVDESVHPVTWITPGQSAANERLSEFLQTRLGAYAQQRNDPNAHAQSNLSPYLHFGHIASQRIALEISRSSQNPAGTETFLEEVIVRKELADNYCLYNHQYDSPAGFPNWAQQTLNDHLRDHREFLYSLDALTRSRTHDPLWNAAQTEMVQSGKMHGYLRMYWAKKILEWTNNPTEAMTVAIHLNDTYSLDGRDPNGYTGITWSIGGVHDRPWFERPIFGKIRYMNFNGAKKKFDVEKYIAMWQR